MVSTANALFKQILEDVERYTNRRKIVRAGMIERITVRKVSPAKLHVNPEDEFSHEEVGPSNAIIEDYCTVIRRNQSIGEPIFPEPIIIGKMESEGYMIYNGHHRWAAALKMRVPAVRVIIVNPRNK